MTDPFKPLRKTSPPPPPEGREVDEATPVSVPCRHCPVMLQRQQYKPWGWVHQDDEVVLKGTSIVSTGKYDHEPEPDVIDVDVLE